MKLADKKVKRIWKKLSDQKEYVQNILHKENFKPINTYKISSSGTELHGVFLFVWGPGICFKISLMSLRLTVNS